MSLLPSIRPASQVKKITSFIKKTVSSAGFTKVVVATSGGIDSATTLTLAVEALGPSHVLMLKMPYQRSHTQSVQHADLMAKTLKIPKRNLFQVNIGPSVERIWKNILIKLSRSQTGLTQLANQIRFGNIQARVRMIYLYDMAKCKKALVCGTENYSEHLLGYFTRFGDEASDLEPIKHLYKTQVRNLAQHLNIPEAIINKAPTAGLWEEQTDEAELGFTYKTADQVLYLKFEQKLSPTQIANKLYSSSPNKSKTYWYRQVKKVLNRVAASEFKHKLPYHI